MVLPHLKYNNCLTRYFISLDGIKQEYKNTRLWPSVWEKSQSNCSNFCSNRSASSYGDTEFTHTIVENLKPIWIKYFFQSEHYTPAEVDLLLEYNISGLLSMYQKWFFEPNGISIERIIQLSYRTLPDTSCFENFDKELRQ